MIDDDENQDEDKLQAHRNAPVLQPRKALAAMLSKATRVLGKKGATGNHAEPVAWYFYPCLLSHVLVPLS